ncbi:KAP family P-loop NTPase fold protein [Roseisolibacter agri]|uniref:KAP NTPase domain-containing protein n=1 Tax=Roseisolibacter agri TaxID=2014610 RepID=A0AA37QEQ0_9BACT|nr:P-loop NTPase fold protein [Roseisolibacter agri]GLC25398.1 hypothetical protein rosag_19110 [Roseisolibacter agri]
MAELTALYRRPEALLNDDADPFPKGDQHQFFAENLTRLVSAIEQPFVIALNGRWGTGKTTFIERWRSLLVLESIVPVTFNAWDTDFGDDPLIAMLGTLHLALQGAALSEAENPAVDIAWAAVREASSKLIRRNAVAMSKLAVQAIAVAAGAGALPLTTAVESVVEDAAKDRIANFEEGRRSLANFRIALGNLVEAVRDPEHPERPLVFFIDELDRCRPSYAIQLLEDLKHCFNVPGIVFVLAIDREQLAHAVRAVYGAGFDGDQYLRRFFDVELQVPTLTRDAFLTSVFARIGVVEFMRKRGNNPVHVDLLVETLAELSNVFDLSLRTQEQIAAQIAAIVRMLDPRFYFPEQLVATLAVVRVAAGGLYAKLRTGHAEILDVVKHVAEYPAGVTWVKNGGINNFVVPLFYQGASPEERARVARQVEQGTRFVDIPLAQNELVAVINGLRMPDLHGQPRNLLKHCLNVLDMTARYQADG